MIPPKLKKFEQWLFEQEKSENTISAYLYAVRNFFENYNNINKGNLIDWKRKLVNDDGKSFKTANNRIAGINAYCEFIGKPECKIKQYKIQKKLSVDNVISLRQYNKLLQCLKDDNNIRWYLIVKTLGMTGVRCSEVLQIKIEDFENRVSTIYNKGKNRKVYLPKSLCEEVIEYYKDNLSVEWLCVNRFGGILTTRGIAQALCNFAEKYNIDKKVMHPHSFRHMFAINFLKNNKNNDIVLLSNLLGHSNINTTAIYLQKTEQEQIRELNRTICW
ncbi:MAG: tyrosine-type recombinase/integrase [Eubacterium sp.]|nr:tyrosine-type recombinase/integrase [Eubacterium sp.]